MDKINGFTITKLSLSGFKCFIDPISFDFGHTTYITASNGLGKSSVADAIAFAFTGTSFYGEKGLDRLHNQGAVEMIASVDFTDDAGKSHNITRYRRRDITSITFDGYTIKQAGLVALFGDKDVFLSILNPLYFINVLGDSGKVLLEKILPVVNKEDVFTALGDSSRKVLEGQTLLSPETFIKNRRIDLKGLEETLIGYRSQKELIERQRKERSEKLKELQGSVNAVTAELAKLTNARNTGFNRAGEESILTELRNRRAKLFSDMKQSSANETIQRKQVEIRGVETLIARLESRTYVSNYSASAIEAEAAIKSLYDEHSKISTALSNTVVGYNCPACAALITVDNVESVRADLRNRLKTLVRQGKEEKGKLAEFRVQDDAERGIFEERKAASLSEHRARLEGLKQQLREIYIACEIDAEGYGEQLESLNAKVLEQERRLTNGNLTTEQMSRFAELSRLEQEYITKIDSLNSMTDYNYTSLIEETEAKILSLKRLISEAIQYAAKRVELMLEGLKMDKTEIVLTEIVKTSGEIKDCFRFSYDGRDYRCLSLSEKVRAGLEVSLLIQRLSNRKYPIFIDNSESICSFGDIQLLSQVILSRVVKNQELRVACKTRNLPHMVA